MESPDNSPLPQTRFDLRRGFGRSIIFVVIAVAAVVMFAFYPSGPQIPEGLHEREYRLAANRFQNQFKRTPTHVEILMTAGELSVNRDPEASLAAFRAVPGDHPEFGSSARLQEGQILVRLNRAEAAEKAFLEFLSLAEGNSETPAAHLLTAWKWLAFIYTVELRLDERHRILDRIHESGLQDIGDSKQLCCPRLLI